MNETFLEKVLRTWRSQSAWKRAVVWFLFGLITGGFFL